MIMLPIDLSRPRAFPMVHQRPRAATHAADHFSSPIPLDCLPPHPAYDQPHCDTEPALNSPTATTATTSTENSIEGIKDVNVGVNTPSSPLDRSSDIEGSAEGPNRAVNADRDRFKTMKWWHVGILMIAETVSLGILALPSTTATFGYIPGLLLILFFGLIAGYAGYIYGTFKLANPQVMHMADAGSVLLRPFGSTFAKLGGRLFGIGTIVFLTFVMSAHILTAGIMLNVLTDHGTCTIVMNAVGAVVSFLFCLPRDLHGVSKLSLVSTGSIVVAIFVTIIGVGLRYRTGAPDAVPVQSGLKIQPAAVALMDIVMAYAGNIAFFHFISEMRAPRDFPKALALVQTTTTCLYIAVAAILYHFVGEHIVSPALGAASHAVRIAAYTVAIPTIFVAGVINGHVAVKMFMQIVREHLVTARGSLAWTWWSGIGAGLWTVAWLIAEAVPDFNHLLALVSALLGSWFTYGCSGAFWLRLYHGRYNESWNMRLLTVMNVAIIFLAFFLCSYGSWASIVGIVQENESRGVFSCKNSDPLSYLNGTNRRKH